MVLLGSVPASAVPTFFGSNAYELITTGDPISWSGAKAAAEASVFGGVSGHLVTILSGLENAFVLGLLGDVADDPIPFVIIGATDGAVEGEWRWVTGELFWQGNAAGTAVLYSNWSPGQPDDFDNIQEFGAMLARSFFPGQSPGQWDDVPDCCFITNYVVEYESASPVPEPTTIVLFSAGALLLARRRRRTANRAS